jgi:hypothetical protein
MKRIIKLFEFRSNGEAGDQEIIFVVTRWKPQKYVGFILHFGALGWTFFEGNDKPKAERKPIPLTVGRLRELASYLEARNGKN